MNAGIIGLGGAGFPAYIKYKFAKDVKKLIINAVECEPFIALGNFCTNGNMVTFLNQYFQIHRRPADQRDKYLAAGFHFHDVYMVAEFLMARNVLTHRSFNNDITVTLPVWKAKETGGKLPEKSLRKC